MFATKYRIEYNELLDVYRVKKGRLGVYFICNDGHYFHKYSTAKEYINDQKKDKWITIEKD